MLSCTAVYIYAVPISKSSSNAFSTALRQKEKILYFSPAHDTDAHLLDSLFPFFRL